MKAKNFAVTLIGGGGGGADGISDSKDYMNVNSGSASFRAEEEGIYRVAVIGAGGGGMGSDDEDGGNNRGIGGQGGAGGAFWGEIKLREGDVCSANVASGGRAGSDGGKKCKYEYNANETWTNFYVNNTLLVQAGTGQSGQSTRNIGGDDPDCGNGGGGGTVKVTNTGGYIQTEVYKGDGIRGRSNQNKRWPHNASLLNKGDYVSGYDKIISNRYYGYIPTYQGATINPVFRGNGSSGPFGVGGYGAAAKEEYGLTGDPGTVMVWRMLQQPGLGGNASPLNSITLATIKGKLVAKVGEGGKRNENGEVSKIEVYDSQGKVTRTMSSSYGAKGVLGDSISSAKQSSTKYVYGGQGQDSLWLAKGGGTPGKCEPGFYDDPETVAYTDYETKVTNIGVHWNIGVVSDIYGSSAQTDTKVNCPEWEGEKTYCIGYLVPKSELDKYNSQNLQSAMFHYNVKLSDAYNNLTSKDYDSDTAFGHAVGQLITEGVRNITSWSKNASNLTGYYKAPTGDPEIVTQKVEQVPVTKYKTERPWRPPSCTTGGDGTYFGAGGGGGGATNQIGLAGKGGKGAPGAVIIEW